MENAGLTQFDAVGGVDDAKPMSRRRNRRSIATSVPKRWLWFIPGVMGLGVVALAIRAIAFHSWAVFGYGFGVSAAAIMTGGLVGFLFGIPRSAPDSTGGETEHGYQGNTNLEQISDWLTKILVGVGLVQLGHAPGALARLAHAMKGGFGGRNTGASFGLSISIFFAVLGFLYLYIWSRIDFIQELRSTNPIEEATKKLKEVSDTLEKLTQASDAATRKMTQASDEVALNVSHDSGAGTVAPPP